MNIACLLRSKRLNLVFLGFLIVLLLGITARVSWSEVLLPFYTGVDSGNGVDSGSYFGVDLNGNLVQEISERIAISTGTDGGIRIAAGTEEGRIQSAGAIDAPWLFLGNTGNYLTNSPIKFIDATTLDFSGWAVDWGSSIIPLGGDPNWAS